MRRLLSFCLFAATLLPLLAPMLSAEAAGQVGVAACCRRGGAHHCMTGMALLPSDGATRVRGPREMCPYQQRALTAGHQVQAGLGVAAGRVPVVLRGADVVAQVECLWRIAFDRARQKRGPPALVS